MGSDSINFGQKAKIKRHRRHHSSLIIVPADSEAVNVLVVELVDHSAFFARCAWTKAR